MPAISIRNCDCLTGSSMRRARSSDTNMSLSSLSVGTYLSSSSSRTSRTMALPGWPRRPRAASTTVSAPCVRPKVRHGVVADVLHAGDVDQPQLLVPERPRVRGQAGEVEHGAGDRRRRKAVHGGEVVGRQPRRLVQHAVPFEVVAAPPHGDVDVVAAGVHGQVELAGRRAVAHDGARTRLVQRQPHRLPPRPRRVRNRYNPTPSRTHRPARTRRVALACPRPPCGRGQS